ncbi:repetitive proline-rich cell wall protein 2 [Drosophila innubila]|uniref:repetitive proline-rich cell wall protein 2 n=1 Tax=Drosophila innubila TaxID=198719 RepID=UPI00148BCEF3|nr:repetitive proline-rich cell wall protein 2 [Drosophila innubila]
MKVLVLALFSLALVAADVSHLFGHDHHHDHHHHHEEHPGYNYEPPQIPFELPTPAPVYLPAKVEQAPKAVYLPPVQPQPTYLPPAPPKPVYVAPVVEEVKSLPIEQPQVNYLPPAPVVPSYRIPIPSYAEPFEPENTYLPPQEIVEPHSDDGYHYDAPSKPFFY